MFGLKEVNPLYLTLKVGCKHPFTQLLLDILYFPKASAIQFCAWSDHSP